MNTSILASTNNVGLIILFVALGIVAIALLVVLYIFVFRPNSYKRQIKDLERKYSYLDALLIGQDTQFIHRLEIVSRTNLLYVDTYNSFLRRFQNIYEIDDKFAISKINQAKNMVTQKQYKNIKNVINDAKNAVAVLEENVNTLDKELYEVIKPEEEARQAILKLKEGYRAVKQTFYASSNDLEFVLASFNKVFDKLDKYFSDFETHIDSAEYDEANALLPEISSVINALKNVLGVMPNLCILITKILPDKIEELNSKYRVLEASQYPLFHLSFRKRCDDWNYRLSSMKKQLIDLDVSNVAQECDSIEDEVDEINMLLDQEVEDKEFFKNNQEQAYQNVLSLNNSFLKVCSAFPKICEYYKVDENQESEFESLKESMNKMDASKRALDTYIHSSTPQPYSILRSKLENMMNDYEDALTANKEFLSYVDSLKTSSEEAYSMVFDYYYRLKEAEKTLSSMNLPELAANYKESIDYCYELLNDIDKEIKIKPINVASINMKVEDLKNSASLLFDEIDTKYRECQLAESAIVYANRDRNQQSGVNNRLNELEAKFFEGDFENVYHQTSDLFKNTHIDDLNSDN